MDGPVLSGGVIVLVAAVLWLLYFLPSWRGRHQYEAAERNALRLNRALRVLAETSETPEEVRLELTARTAHAQQRLARRVQSEREAAELERLRGELAAARADPTYRRARARRRIRLIASLVIGVGTIVTALGTWQLVASGSSVMLWVGAAANILALVVLQRMRMVIVRAARRAVPERHRSSRLSEAAAQTTLHDQGPRKWTPRSLPQPMVSVAGSRAQAAQAAIDAQELAREATRVAEFQRRADLMAAPRPAHQDVAEGFADASASSPGIAPEASSSPYARMGYVDDAEIEAHVRQLLARRAAG